MSSAVAEKHVSIPSGKRHPLRPLRQSRCLSVTPHEIALTEREKCILEHVAQGSSNGEIADFVEISVNTVKYHLQNAFRKLGVRNRTKAVLIASRKQLINIPR